MDKIEAGKFVDTLPEGQVRDQGAIALLNRSLHLGVDASGKRLTPEERRIYEKTFHHLTGKVMEEFRQSAKGVHNHYSHTQIFLNHHLRIQNSAVQEELIERCLDTGVSATDCPSRE